MAEGFARAYAEDDWEVYSAGLEPSRVNPRAIQVMAEQGIDIRQQWSKGLDAVPLSDLSMVVTLCGDAEERCPMLPGQHTRIHWPLSDPAKAEGTNEQIMAVFRAVRDDIQWRVRDLLHGGTGQHPTEA
jgi:arsenate reductase